MNDTLLTGWLNYESLEKSYRDLLLKQRPINCFPVSFSDDNYFKLMINSNIDSSTNCLKFSECATDFIKKLFQTYVDDNTLVLSSSDEHDNVKECISNVKNKLILDYHNDVMKLNIRKIENELNKYKKVFVYIIGTQISTGEITPQEFFIQLKKRFEERHIEHIIVLDDVHGMFLFPRDYRLFDFVLFTAHALVKGYDMGLLCCKRSLDFDYGYSMCNWAREYWIMLQLILERKDKLFMFKSVMENYFSDLIVTGNFMSLTRTSPHIFSMLVKNVHFPKLVCDKLNEYKIRIENTGEKTYVRFRAQHYIQKPELLIEGVEKFRVTIDELLYMQS